MKSPYWSGLASSLSPYVPGEQPRGRTFIKLNTNENPYPPSPKVAEAIRGVETETLRLYPDPACTLLRDAVAKRWKVSAEQVFAGNGSDEILAFAFAAFFRGRAENGLPVLFPDITYSFYPVYAALWNIPYETPGLASDFSINPGDYKRPCGGVIFPNPNAPTGRALAVDTLKEIAAAQAANNKVLIVDEAYTAFADRPGFGSMIPFINEFPNLLVVRTLSKDASLAGLRSGYAVGSAELVEGLCALRDSFNSYTVDRIAQAASVAAVLDSAYYDETNAKVCRTRDRISAALERLGFTVIPSQANFIFVSPPKSAPNAAAFMAALREKGILARHFSKPKISNFIRVTIGTDADMDTFVAACAEISRSRP